MGLVAGAGVLTAVGAVVVGSVAGSVVVVVVALEERVVRRTVGETAADAHTTAAVAAAHRLAPPVLSHTVLLLESGGEIHSPRSGSVSSPIDSGETPTSADAKADIYINTGILCQAILRK